MGEHRSGTKPPGEQEMARFDPSQKWVTPSAAARGRGPGDPAFRAKHMGPGNATTAKPDPVGPVSWEGTWLAVGPCKASSVQRPLEG
ncbi:unnamed protein product [Arctogadus glacialis]